MAVRIVLQETDPTLRKKSKPVKDFDEDLETLLNDMKKTMHVNHGMGIAAVQVGVLRRAIVIECNGMTVELINPEIIRKEGECIDSEGCLSVGQGKFYGDVKRPKKVTVRAQDRTGQEFELTVSDYFARCVCHEVDHLDGILFIDKCIDKNAYAEFKKAQ